MDSKHITGCSKGKGFGETPWGVPDAVDADPVTTFRRATPNRKSLGRANVFAAMLRGTTPTSPCKCLSDDCQIVSHATRRAVPLIGLAAWQRALEVPTSFDPIGCLSMLGDTETATQATGIGPVCLRKRKQPSGCVRTAGGVRETVQRLPET